MFDYDERSSDGPVCPYCQCILDPCDESFYEERGYVEEECPDCERTFRVGVINVSTWYTKKMESSDD